MIKIFRGKPDAVSIKVNDFMKEQGKDLPVRTDIDDKGEYVATVFYNGVLAIDQLMTPLSSSKKDTTDFNIGEEEVVKDSKGSDDKVGALWIQKDKSIRGKFQGGNYAMLNVEAMKKEFTEVTSKAGNPMLEGTIEDVEVRIIKNGYKKTENQPDFIIFKK